VTSRLNLGALLRRSAHDLRDALDQASPAKQYMTLKTLTWIAWSMRPLEPEEMFAALATRTEVDALARGNILPNEEVCPATDEELISLCPKLLEIRTGRRVAFRNEHLRSLVRSPWATGFGFASAEAAHESLAAVCFGHLGCIHSETILRPWVRTGPMLRREIRHCHFRSYCTNHWQDHYRAAEPSSRKLVSMLHSTLDSAFDARAVAPGLEDSSPRYRMSTGVWICSLWDLKILGRTYLEMGADVDHSVGLDESPLHVAAANSSTNMLRLLLDRGANLELRDTSGHTALQQACRAGALDVAALLLQKGADPESSRNQPSCTSPVALSSNRTPLHLAATYGHSNIVQALLEAGSNVQASTGDSNCTALHFAVEHGSENVVRYLMDWGADPEAENALSEKALKIAINERHDSIVRLLIQRGARRTSSTARDEIYLNGVLGSESITSTVQQFQSLSFESTNVSHDAEHFVQPNISRLPIIVIPTSCTRFDDTVESAAEHGWTIVDKMEVDA
jgi:ankyrin repeat protein